MDPFTRNYSIVLGLVIVLGLAWALYEDPDVSALNDILEQNAELASYPYQFRVLRLKNGVAAISTPRSSAFPMQRALPVLFPELKNKAQDNPRMMGAQAEMARLQKQAKAIVLESDKVMRVQWELDKDWLIGQGVQLGSGL